jgi:hypothetical protein
MSGERDAIPAYGGLIFTGLFGASLTTILAAPVSMLLVFAAVATMDSSATTGFCTLTAGIVGVIGVPMLLILPLARRATSSCPPPLWQLMVGALLLAAAACLNAVAAVLIGIHAHDVRLTGLLLAIGIGAVSALWAAGMRHIPNGSRG